METAESILRYVVSTWVQCQTDHHLDDIRFCSMAGAGSIADGIISGVMNILPMEEEQILQMVCSEVHSRTGIWITDQDRTGMRISDSELIIMIDKYLRNGNNE